jgi:hypothetical protein
VFGYIIVLPGAFSACTCILALVASVYCQSTFSMKRWYTPPFCGSLSKRARHGAGTDVFATHSDPYTNADPALEVFHTAELPYLFGSLSTSGPPKVANFTRAMMDYWVSFTVTLGPNDGKKTSSTS